MSKKPDFGALMAAIEESRKLEPVPVDQVTIDDGMAVFRDKAGRPLAWMNADDYAALQNEGDDSLVCRGCGEEMDECPACGGLVCLNCDEHDCSDPDEGDGAY